jgi:hypothetical protein
VELVVGREELKRQRKVRVQETMKQLNVSKGVSVKGEAKKKNRAMMTTRGEEKGGKGERERRGRQACE